ncbi:hypothetical protein [Burkholderia multivorans]|uniref:hypothetical protein n=1 Tax=Burkholderia multivorans TaxID=87883 RepID=UPI000A4CAA61|nr:hypothetical protein [Burkholderia multivorans]MDR9230031.1 hypothetical protein [Burkholderia multivorans]HDR9474396.1 hypothetical protein [Burkholderia multivorans]HDR9480238.1 hypothetical protein [Burkholderia multivorans]
MQDLFSMALEARCKWALARAYDPAITGDDADSEMYETLMECAEDLARSAGYEHRYDETPFLLADVPLLCDAFEHVASMMLDDEAAYKARIERDAERERDRKAEHQRIRTLVAAEAWGALCLPTPAELTATLLAEESATVGGHFVVYEKEQDVVWYTSPYGIDGVLCNTPTIDDMRAFLVDMAYGVEYGPIP